MAKCCNFNRTYIEVVALGRGAFHMHTKEHMCTYFGLGMGRMSGFAHPRMRMRIFEFNIRGCGCLFKIDFPVIFIKFIAKLYLNVA